ncbi:bifunctional phosphopantothenoylcysteine decarboxylase/phosphopantothenate--cysteine ligase CoaBC [Alkalibacterium sp. 20]|uniref:bifunctional phosphopantothenoylcysteine decarboxylase/phosphopantothenate--cysteine ligase CoaBC n=1 Tax=Alkalibacterium sp. 20 TaxID=1798803 RepID=UPI0008FFE986|nr:bifunctional phosphopantothenoylcysteine decarboxylase/phosphopantothenate--cysteine ligase CoaBC [Alkalibacterium sp. 20]OJF89735.1 phosphopantothenoylcysteine decarboxylase [Alkalibacterium sp. 20]
MLKGKKVALYVTGGIAVYKVVDLMRTLIKSGAEVQVAMTESATQFVSPLTFQVLSKKSVYVDVFTENDPEQVSHIHFADWADVAIVAPLTANTLAKMAYGMADDFVSTALLATTCPIFAIPTMNHHMFENQATQANIKTLRERKVYVMDPDEGFLAEGYSGKGRFPEQSRIIDELCLFLRQSSNDLPLEGKSILVTAGGTKERIDPVRFISNDSSGKMGHAVAEAAWGKGAEVTLITASSLPVSSNIRVERVESANEMYEAVSKGFDTSDALVMAAAVSDYTPEVNHNQKMKKQEHLTLKLKKTPDILSEMGKRKRPSQCLVGFAAETENLTDYAKKKLVAKKADLIVANEVGKSDRGFNVDENEVTFISHQSDPQTIQLKEKKDIAKDIIDWIIEFIN